MTFVGSHDKTGRTVKGDLLVSQIGDRPPHHGEGEWEAVSMLWLCANSYAHVTSYRPSDRRSSRTIKRRSEAGFKISTASPHVKR